MAAPQADGRLPESHSGMFEAPFFAFLGAATLNLVATPWLIRYLRERSLLDIPNARSSHDQPVPRGAGIAIVGTWLLGMCSTWALRYPLPALGIMAPDGFVLGTAAGMCVLAFLGYQDDRHNLNPYVKLVAQVAVTAGALWQSGLRVADLGLPFGGAHDLGALGWVFAIVWLVGFTNIFNFMDGINGLAFTQLTVAGAAFCLMGVATDDYELAIAGALASGAALGTLKYNFPRALIFMGDVGSLPSGFLLAMLALRAGFGARAEGTPWIAALFVLWPFLWDGGFTLVNRVYHRRNPFRPHRSHLYQRLFVTGMSHKAITLRYGVAMLACAIAGLAGQRRDPAVLRGALALILLGSALYTFRVVRRVRASMTEGRHVDVDQPRGPA